MQIIPVLDIRGGLVVHAQGGERANYQPWQSCLTKATTPVEVIADLLAWYRFPIIYIADLDAIDRGSRDISLIEQIVTQFPDVVFWLDAGISTTEDAHYYQHLGTLRLVLGSETLRDPEVFYLAGHNPPVLSLDKKNNQLLAKIDLFAYQADWPDEIIAMHIDAVGSDAGPALDWIDEIRRLKPDAHIFAAGGVRNDVDLSVLAHRGVAGGLIASALHRNKLSKESVTAFMEQEHCPR